MKRTGYSPTFSGAVEAVASTGGQIMPPIMGSIAFVMASLLGVSYRTVALAAAIPAALYFVALFTQTDLRAAKDGLRGMEKSALPSFMTALKGGWEFVIPIILLVTLLFGLRYPPSLVGVYSIGMLILISMFRKKNRISLKGIVDSLEATSRAMLMIAPILAAAGIIVALLGATGLGPRMASSLVYISGGNIAVLFILAAIASYILGMGGAMIVSYIVLAVLVAPALEMVGVPLMVSHFFVFYMGLTMFFTPPVCPTAFIAAGIAKAPAFATGFQAMRLGIVTFLVPFILIYNPALILIGEPIQIALATITAVIGVFALSVGVERYLFTKVSWLQSILAISAGITMMVPGWTSDVIGIGLLGLLLLWQWRSRKNRRATLGQNIGMDLTDGA
jgi:TRAP transporter 4TM/12TM fusion protein